MMTPAEVLEMGEAICQFLQAQGGAYKNLSADVIRNVYFSLGTGDYVWEPGKYFVCYWRIRPEDVEDVKNRIKPFDITSGTVMYVAEAASTGSLNEAVKELRKQAKGMKGLFWHRPTKKDKVYNFPSQQGA